MMKPNTQNDKATIEAMLRAAHELLLDQWNQISNVCEAMGDELTISLQWKLDRTGEAPHLKTSIGFNRKFQDGIEIDIDVGQTTFAFVDAVTRAKK